VSTETRKRCWICNGTGAGRETTTCPDCKGWGGFEGPVAYSGDYTAHYPIGPVQCDTCDSSGTITRQTSCWACKGKGYIIIEKGIPDIPPSVAALVGTYRRDEMSGDEVSLSLRLDKTFTANLFVHTQIKTRRTTGRWTLAGDHISLTAVAEHDIILNHVGELEALRFRDGWILLPTTSRIRSHYEEFGVTRYNCFQQTDRD
jgi:hypothetical protein